LLSKRRNYPPPEILSRFLACLTRQVTEGEYDAQGVYEDLLRLVLTEFEALSQRGNAVHVPAAQLHSTRAKRLDAVGPAVLANPLTDLSKHTNLLYFVPLPNKPSAFMKPSEDRETLKNNLTSFEKSSAFMTNWWRIILRIVSSYFHHFLEVPAEAKYIPSGLML